MSHRKQQLQKLLDLAKQNEMFAAKDLAVQQKTYHEYKAQLDNLLEYQQSYRTRIDEKSHQTIKISSLQRDYAFMHSLEQTIKQQHQAIHDVKQILKKLRENWSEKNKKSQALEHLIAKLSEEEKFAENRLEQSANDEHTIQRYFKRD